MTKLKEIEKYYLLGFIYADGTINKNNSRIQIRLSYKDISFLKKIAKKLDRKINIYNAKCKNKTYKSCRLELNSTDSTFFNNLGVIANKTYQNDSKFFDCISDKYKWHFIRGYFDGDGSIFKRIDNKKSLYPKHVIGFVSLNKRLLNSIRLYINNSLNLKAKLRLDVKYYRLIYSGNIQVKKICLELYKNKGILFLDRKYLIYKNISIFKPKFYSYNKIRKNPELKQFVTNNIKEKNYV